MFNQGTNNAPSAKSVIPFFVLSAFSWLFALIFIGFHPNSVLTKVFFNEVMLSITHILMLGFVTSVIFGALFQLLPVIFLQKTYSERLIKIIFCLLVIGTIGLCFSFYFDSNGQGLTGFGTILNLAVILFIINVWKTIGKSIENNVAKLYIKTSVVWLALTTIAGLLLAINFWVPFLPFAHLELLKLHAHFGVIGWFIFLIIGVSSVLIPMFLLVHQPNKKLLYVAYFFLLLSLILGGVSKLLNQEVVMYCAYLFAALGFVFYLSFIYKVHQSRARKFLDYGLKKSMLAYSFLILAIAIGFLFIIGINVKYNLSAFYIVVLVIGFVATLIMGQFYKTLPFILWLKIYKPFVGKEKTLLPKDLYNNTILKYQYYFHIAGLILFCISLPIQWLSLFYVGLLLLVIGAILFFINVLKIVFHKKQTV